MPTSSGPNIQHGSNLVFDYDTGDVVNSYIGEPTTNLLSSYFNTDYVMVGSEFSQYADLAPIFNTYGYGPSYTYSLSLDMKVNKNGGVLVYMQNGSYTKYSFVYQSVNATTEYQRFTFPGLNANLSTPSETLAILAFYTGYGSGVTPTVKNVQVELKPHATPYIKGTRSATQGLLDISGKGNTITLNTSYDSSAQMYFDGTDDYIELSSNGFNTVFNTQNYTIETVIYPTRDPDTSEGVLWSYDYTSHNNPYYAQHLRLGGSGGVSDELGFYWNNGSTYYGFTVGGVFPILNKYYHIVATFTSGYQALYVNGTAIASSTRPDTITYYNSPVWIGKANFGGYFNGSMPIMKFYNTALTSTQVQQNYNQYKSRFNLPNVPYIYSEGANANLYTANWNNSTTYTMADFGGLPNVTAHGFSSGPVTYTLTLNALPPHTRVRYKVFWHLVDSLDNETNQLFLSTSSGESEILRFTKVYNSAPNISVAASPGTYTWSGPKTYTYRPWANGYYNQDGYIIVDSGYIDHTASTFTARHVMGADQAQADEAEYLSHVEVEISG